MIEWLFNGALHILLTLVPTWVWIVVAGLAIGWAWRTFGWQGIVGAGLAILAIFSYRQGWRDRGAGKQPIVPVADEPIHRTGRGKSRVILRTAKRSGGKREYNPDTNEWE